MELLVGIGKGAMTLLFFSSFFLCFLSLTHATVCLVP